MNATTTKPRILADNTKDQAPDSDNAKNIKKAADFKRLASVRTGKAIERITQIGHLSSRSAYSYSPEQITKIEAALTGAVTETMARFKNEKTTAPTFTL